jgi:hypothetical protein
MVLIQCRVRFGVFAAGEQDRPGRRRHRQRECDRDRPAQAAPGEELARYLSVRAALLPLSPPLGTVGQRLQEPESYLL